MFIWLVRVIGVTERTTSCLQVTTLIDPEIQSRLLYLFATGCYFSMGNIEKTQELLDAIPGLIDKKKVGGKDLPTEVYIKKKRACPRLLAVCVACQH